MTDDPGLAAALGDPCSICNAPHPWNRRRDRADAALAWVDARLADPATVKAVAGAIGDYLDRTAAEEMMPLLLDQATAVLDVVRGLLGGTGGDAP